jgi:hypothetical protein
MLNETESIKVDEYISKAFGLGRIKTGINRFEGNNIYISKIIKIFVSPAFHDELVFYFIENSVDAINSAGKEKIMMGGYCFLGTIEKTVTELKRPVHFDKIEWENKFPKGKYIEFEYYIKPGESISFKSNPFAKILSNINVVEEKNQLVLDGTAYELHVMTTACHTNIFFGNPDSPFIKDFEYHLCKILKNLGRRFKDSAYMDYVMHLL